jgi:hypothetical protein
MVKETKTTLEYVHQELDKEVTALAGYYKPLEELRLKYNGREVLCIAGISVIECSCCGSGGCAYAIVPGYIVSWKLKKNDAGLPISKVETISDKKARQEIAAVLKEDKSIGNVEFW